MTAPLLPGGLVVRDLCAGYGTMNVLGGVSLYAPPGEAVALLGPNGAGKSTLLEAVAGGSATIRSGEVFQDGEPLTGAPAHRLADRGICYVPEGRAIFPSLSIEENLLLFSGGDRAALSSAYDVFPVLGERARQVASTLSGGEQQMLALSRALVRPFKTLLVDELSMGLAPVVIDRLFEVLAAMKAEDRSLVIVEQYAQRALDLADTVYVLTQGTIVFAGDVEEVRRRGMLELGDLYLDATDGHAPRRGEPLPKAEEEKV